MTKIDQLKCQLIDKYSNMLQKLQIGYPMGEYCIIVEAMQAVNYIENDISIPDYTANTILDEFSARLTLI